MTFPDGDLLGYAYASTRADKLGRIDKITLDGKDLCEYDYLGMRTAVTTRYRNLATTPATVAVQHFSTGGAGAGPRAEFHGRDDVRRRRNTWTRSSGGGASTSDRGRRAGRGSLDTRRFAATSTRLCGIFRLLYLAMLACGPLAAEEPLRPRVAGIRVVSHTTDPIANERDPVNRAWPFNSLYHPLYQGTHIDILIPSPPGGFVGNNYAGYPEIGKIIKAVDSRGKDLAAPRVHQVMGQPWSIEAHISDLENTADGSAVMLSVFLPQTPTPDAGSLELAGDVPLKHSGNLQEFKASGVNIKRTGTSFQLGSLALKVKRIFTIEPNGRKVSLLELESPVICETLQKLEIQVDGKTLRAFKWDPYLANTSKDRPCSYTCVIDGVPDQVDVVAAIFQDDPATLTIPFAASAGLGLTAGENGDPPLISFAPEDPQVTVAGFEIINPSDQALMPHGYKSHGTKIALTLVRAAGGMIKLDSPQCRIEQATDSKGKDLTTPVANARDSESIVNSRFATPVSAWDGFSGGVEIRLPQAPTPGANSIRFRASIALLCNDETVEYKAAAVDLTKAGAVCEAGPFRFEATRPEASGEFDKHSPCAIKMKTLRNPNEIKQVTLRIGDQTLVADRGICSSSDGVFEASYLIHGLAKLPPEADLMVTVYKDVEDLKPRLVQVEGTIGLGMPTQR